MHLTVGVFCDRRFFEKFGKAGTNSDILIRNHSDSSGTFTFVHPLPERIQPAMQAAAMCDFPIIAINEINQEVGETLILLSEIGFRNGLIVTDFLENEIKNMINDMPINGFDFCKKIENDVWEKIRNAKIDRPLSPALVTIDTFFDVKGAGAVVLGLVKSGSVKQYDKLVCYPIRKEVLVKSMQSQDKEIKETEPGHRIGIAMKGAETSELKRGFVLSSSEIRCADRLSVAFSRSRFSMYDVSEGRQIFVSVGQHVVSGTVKKTEGDRIEVQLSQDVALYSDRCVFATNDSRPRIIGSGRIL